MTEKNADPTNADLCFDEVAKSLQSTLAEIEALTKQIQSLLGQHAENQLVQQVGQQLCMLPMLLNQQHQMLIRLEAKYGEQFMDKCRGEVEGILGMAKEIQELMGMAKPTLNSNDDEAKSQFAGKTFSCTTKLNLLQQRISGKMMKVSL